MNKKYLKKLKFGNENFDLNIKDPFSVEKFRNFLSIRKCYEKFKKTYKSGFEEIVNVNSNFFWDEVFNTESNNKSNSYMVNDKISDLVSFLISKKGKLLDIGIGSGTLEKEIARRDVNNLSTYGIDISSVAVSLTKSLFDGGSKTGSILNIPFDKNFFDIVVALEVLEHISPSNLFKALSEVKRVLKRGGLFIVSVPLNENLEELIKQKKNLSGHVRNYTEKIIETEINIAGFTVVNKYYYYAFSRLYRIKKILKKTLLKKRWEPNDILLISKK